MQLLVYATAISPRLQYVCGFIFKDVLCLDYAITTNLKEFENYGRVKLKYVPAPVSDEAIVIGDCGLLFEPGIREQETTCFETMGYPAFFKTTGASMPFDIFSATFYLLSRYEEYLPHSKDMYGRYAHENSLAYKNGFLHLSLINIWVNRLADLLKSKYPGAEMNATQFSFLPTYDIDMAYSYLHKGWWRNIGGFIQSPSLERMKVLAGVEEDPFDAYNWLNELHQSRQLQPIYFFLMAEKNSRYDKNILPSTEAMHNLVRQHVKSYRVGIHPSWQSGDDPALLKAEKRLLEKMSGLNINASRQHYIRFNLPEGYRRLLAIGVTDDYSMGYGSINGFRASVASSFFWYDLEKDETSSLRIHPYCFMDANSFYEQEQTAAEAYNELMSYYEICKQTGGRLITIWHNNFLGTGKQFADWKLFYKQFVLQLNR